VLGTPARRPSDVPNSPENSVLGDGPAAQADLGPRRGPCVPSLIQRAVDLADDRHVTAIVVGELPLADACSSLIAVRDHVFISRGRDLIERASPWDPSADLSGLTAEKGERQVASRNRRFPASPRRIRQLFRRPPSRTPRAASSRRSALPRITKRAGDLVPGAEPRSTSRWRFANTFLCSAPATPRPRRRSRAPVDANIGGP